MPQETLGYVKLEWTCPKCGVTQPITDTCTACQVIITKYVKRQSLMRGSSPPRQQGKGTPATSSGLSLR